MKWNVVGRGGRSLVCINLLNGHVGGGHFVWQPQEEQDTESDNASGHCLSLGALFYVFFLLIINGADLPELLLREPLTAVRAYRNQPWHRKCSYHQAKTFFQLLWLFYLIPTHNNNKKWCRCSLNIFFHPYLFFIHTFVNPDAFPSCQVQIMYVFIAPVHLLQAEARVYLLASHSGGAQWKSRTVAAFVLSFSFPRVFEWNG